MVCNERKKAVKLLSSLDSSNRTLVGLVRNVHVVVVQSQPSVMQTGMGWKSDLHCFMLTSECAQTSKAAAMSPFPAQMSFSLLAHIYIPFWFRAPSACCPFEFICWHVVQQTACNEERRGKRCKIQYEDQAFSTGSSSRVIKNDDQVSTRARKIMSSMTRAQKMKRDGDAWIELGCAEKNLFCSWFHDFTQFCPFCIRVRQ